MFYFQASCTQDVSIMKVYDDRDTSSEDITSEDYSEDTTEDMEDTVVDQDEPSYEPQEYFGYGGYIEYSLRQVACPQCIGESQEINVFLYSEFYQPISDSQFNWIDSGGCSSSFMKQAYLLLPLAMVKTFLLTGMVEMLS